MQELNAKVLQQESQLAKIKVDLANLRDLLEDQEPPKSKGWKDKLCSMLACYPGCQVD